jgi:hypothetical protein
MTRRKRSDELDAALRADPDYQELGRLLDKQTDAQKARFEKSLKEAEAETMKSPKKPTTIPLEWIAPLRKLIREEMQTMTPNAAMATNAPDLAPPPTPREEGSKKYKAKRATLPGCRVDKVLYDKFVEDRDKAGSASQIMQKILWTYYGRPKLSFEADD